MNRKSISLFLVVVMMLTLLPFGALAADEPEEPSEAGYANIQEWQQKYEDQIANAADDNPGEDVISLIGGVASGDNSIGSASGSAIGSASGDCDVAVFVYGTALSNFFINGSWSLDTIAEAFKREANRLIRGGTFPEVEMYLKNVITNQEYPMTVGAVPKAAFLSSFDIRIETSWLKWLNNVIAFLQSGFGWLVQSLEMPVDVYKIYGAKGLPEGPYSLHIKDIEGNDYCVRLPAVDGMTTWITDDHINYLGHPLHMGQVRISTGEHWYTFGQDIEVFSASVRLPGVFLADYQPYMEFTSADVGGNPLPGTEFVMVNRDETLNLVNAFLKFGKETFTNIMAQTEEEGFNWDEVNLLKYDLLHMDLEGQQITMDKDEAYRLVSTFWKILAKAGDKPLKEFMDNDTNIRLPAILYATADDKGIVRFEKDSNVTMVWSLEILVRMAGLVGKNIGDITSDDILKQFGNFDDSKMIKAILVLVIDEAKNLLEHADELWDENGEVAADLVNEWIYPMLQNDNLIDYAETLINYADGMKIPFVGEINIPKEVRTIMEYLPHHGLLTSKMPDGNYVMLETGVPSGYFHNPLFYTLNIVRDKSNVYNTYAGSHVSVGNVGLIAPYFAEDFYSWLRTTNFNGETDKLLNYITFNQTEKLFGTSTPIQDVMSGTDKYNMTEKAVEHYINTMYQIFGVEGDSETIQTDAKNIAKYFKTGGDTVQNLLIMGNNMAKSSKSVITDNITRDWKFYTPSTSIRKDTALHAQSFAKALSEALVTNDTTIVGKVNTAVKAQIDYFINNVDTTTNRTEKYVNAAKGAVKKNVSGILSKVIDKAAGYVKNRIGELVDPEKRAISPEALGWELKGFVMSEMELA